MPAFNDVSVKFVPVDATYVDVQVGPETHRIERATLRAAIRGEHKMIDHLLFNIGVRLALAGVDVTKDAQIKTAIEGATFKF